MATVLAKWFSLSPFRSLPRSSCASILRTGTWDWRHHCWCHSIEAIRTDLQEKASCGKKSEQDASASDLAHAIGKNPVKAVRASMNTTQPVWEVGNLQKCLWLINYWVNLLNEFFMVIFSLNEYLTSPRQEGETQHHTQGGTNTRTPLECHCADCSTTTRYNKTIFGSSGQHDHRYNHRATVQTTGRTGGRHQSTEHCCTSQSMSVPVVCCVHTAKSIPSGRFIRYSLSELSLNYLHRAGATVL